MHRIYTESYMQAKANAIRHACNLPATEKMTPPEMADKLLQYAADPGLIYTVNDYILREAGVQMPSTRLLCPVFDSAKFGNLDFNVYNKLMITFNIHDCSYTHNGEFSIDQLNVNICQDQGWPPDNISNNPLRPLLHARPVELPHGSNVGNGQRGKRSLIEYYKSTLEGVVLTFSNLSRYAPPDSSPADSATNVATFVRHKLDHVEDKDVSIILYRNDPDTYSVFVDGVLQFTDKRIEPDVLPQTAGNRYESFNNLSCISINDDAVYYGVPATTYPEELYGWCILGARNRADAWCFPYDFNGHYKSDISFNSLTVKYIK